jgi:transposase
MGYNLLPYEREQAYLMPPSIREWLGEKHLAWFVVDAVVEMDLGEFYAVYRNDGWGAAAYDPGMMVGVLLYAYCRGIRSSRRIAQYLEEDVGFRVVAANQQPDFRTIARFRAEHEEALKHLFIEVLRMCREAGLVKLGVVALDGTKVAANASMAANRSYEAIQEEVEKILAEAKAVDGEEDVRYGAECRGDELPEGLGRRKERVKRLKEAKARLEREATEATQAAQQHLAQRETEEVATGKKKRGRKPKEVASTPGERAKANVTDPDSRVMKTSQGYVQGYNVQLAVSQDQIILAVGVTQQANDVHQLAPMLKVVEVNLEAAGIAERPRVALADAGYWSEANMAACTQPDGPELLLATTKDWKQRKAARERGCPRGRIPRGLGPKERMERKLLTQRGKGLYRLRGQLVEPVNGQVKEGQGLRRFMRRGLVATGSEASLVATTHNLLKLWRSGKAPGARWN